MLVSIRELMEFMRLTTISESQAEAQIRHAEAIVAEEIQGELEHATVSEERHKILYDMTSEYGIQTRRGPISAVSSLIKRTSNSRGTDTDVEQDLDDLVIGNWTIKHFDGFSAHTYVVVNYEVGFRQHGGDSAGQVVNGGNLPSAIREAILGVASELYRHPDQMLTSERIGDYSYTLRDKDSGEYRAVSPKTCLLLKAYKRPMI